ncbi:MAG: hypothetical protein QM811_02795 [Pirellulales bacterium]
MTAATSHDTFQHALCGAACATVATTAAVAAAGQLENGRPLGPINAVSHILFGDEAAAHDEPSLQYTLSGLALNAGAVAGWAVVGELLFGGKRRPTTLPGASAAGAATSAIAYVTDYHLVPDRLTPGFEKRLSNGALAAVYGVLAVGLGLGIWGWGRRR